MALLCACSFDASGFGEVPATLAGTGSSDGSGGPLTGTTGSPATTGLATSTSTAGLTGTATGDPTTGPIDPGTTTGTGDLTTSTTGTTTSSTTAPDTTTGTSGTTDDTTTTSTTGPPPCEGMPVKQIELAKDAMVTPPMQKMWSNLDGSEVAYSPQWEAGTATFTFDIDCDGGTFYVWGRVLDYHSGVNNNDPDSYYVRVDGGPESGWFYGCQTGQLSGGYHWLRVRLGTQGAPCDSYTPLVLQLTPGPHTITLRNREGEDDGNHVAAVARLLITSDPNYVPTAPSD